MFSSINPFLFVSPVLPTIRARQMEVNATADIGSVALLACDADGFPEPTVTWAQYVNRHCSKPLSRANSRVSLSDLPQVRSGVDLSCHKKLNPLFYSEPFTSKENITK